MSDFLIGYIIGFSVDTIFQLILIPVKKKWRRECNYDCSKCRVWDCGRFDCIRQMEKDKKNT